MNNTKKPVKRGVGGVSPHHSRTDTETESIGVSAALEECRLQIALQAIRISELEEENRKLRSARWSTEEFLQNEIRKAHKEKSDLVAKLELANKQLAWFRAQKFAGTSEKTKVLGAMDFSRHLSWFAG